MGLPCVHLLMAGTVVEAGKLAGGPFFRGFSERAFKYSIFSISGTVLIPKKPSHLEQESRLLKFVI